jgi:hypothetical protein
MSQTQIQTQKQTQIIQTLKDLRKALPIDVWKFKELVEEATNCEFYYDESVVPERELEISKNVRLYVHDREYVDIVCNEETVTIEFKNTIYVDNLKTNMIYLIHYEVGA